MLAILVNAMQNDATTEGHPAEVGPMSRRIIPSIQKLIEAARSKGIPIVYVNDCHFPDDPMVLAMGRPQHCIQGTRGYQVVDALAPRENDFIINRRKLSGFFGTDLHIILHDALKVDTIVMTGVVLEFGMYASILDAAQLGYKTILPTDCCATRSEERAGYVFSLLGFLSGIKITTSDELIKQINDGNVK